MAECDCEDSSQSEHPSPGLVDDGERLIRLVFLPEQLNPDGTIKPTSLEKSELKRELADRPPARGFSVHREGHVQAELLRSRAIEFQLRKPEERKAVDAYGADVSEVRKLMIDGQRSLCVVDVALEDDPSHAECWGAAPSRGNAVLKKIRADLAGLFRPVSRVA